MLSKGYSRGCGLTKLQFCMASKFENHGEHTFWKVSKTQLGEFLLGGISRQLEILQLGEFILGGTRSECACSWRIIQPFLMFWKIIIKNIMNFSLQLHESTGAHAIVCPYPQLGYFFLGDIFELRLPAFLKHTFSNTSTNHNIVAVSFSPFSQTCYL